MCKIIKNDTIVNDNWKMLYENDFIEENVKLLEDHVIVPFKFLKKYLKFNSNNNLNIGIWINSDEYSEELKCVLKKNPKQFKVIAINFIKFTDGRGYSIAYNLRMKFNYTGELRAIGDVLQDQLFYMKRVGFNSFVIRHDKNINSALHGLNIFSQKYQTSADEKIQLFRRVNRLF
ncbi:DUF934 domain-containing protein [Candidatus Profftella armatura]|uniref:DUF934 domain-containing protein n=1 Tax=Candidatus Profftella armatura TaxID=669502 RepID=UPI003D9A09E5